VGGTYKLPNIWFEAGIVHTHLQRLISGLANSTSTTPRRLIGTNPRTSGAGSYHVVAWDVRDRTPGLKEWLDSIRQGDVIGVYACYRDKSRGECVVSAEVEIYCED
jgi:hypothetical protein